MKIVNEIKDLVQLEKVFADRCSEEKKNLDKQKSDLAKIAVQLGDSFAMDF